MHYVKQFNINGVDTKQVACIELHGKPNAATEGHVGVLGIDVTSPLHEVYKCVAVNGSIYTWELLSSGLSTISATIAGSGETLVQFPYSTLNIPNGYVLKVGDLIIDSKGYEYQVSVIDATSCSATYCGVAFLKGDPGVSPHVGENGNWWVGDEDTGIIARIEEPIITGTYTGNGAAERTISLGFKPRAVLLMPSMGYTVHFPTNRAASYYGGLFTPEMPLSHNYNTQKVVYAEITDNGFKVYYATSGGYSSADYINASNQNGIVFSYVAVR